MGCREAVLVYWIMGIFLISSPIFGQNSSKEIPKIDYSRDVIHRMISNDSIAKAQELLDDLYRDKNLRTQKDFLLFYNYGYGVILMNSGRYKESNNYFKKAAAISSLLPGNPFEFRLRVVMLRLFRETKQYSKIDSLYIKYKSNKEIRSNIRFFFHLNDYVVSKMQRGHYKEAMKVTGEALAELNNFDFTNQPKDLIFSINKVVRNELKLYYALACIELGEDFEKSFEMLNEVEKDSLYFVSSERDEYLSMINQYKSRYFFEHKKLLDSSYYYQRLSNNYKDISLQKLKKRIAEMDKFIYELAVSKSEMEKLSIINKKNIQLNRNYTYISLLIGFLLVMAILFSAYAYKANNHKKEINKELKKKNKELLAIDEERNRFFSMISHELRTPIYTIQGLAEIIENTEDVYQKQEYLKTLKFSNNHLSGLVNNALEYSKFRLGNVKLNKEPFILDELLREIGNSFSYELSKNNTNLHVDFPESLENKVLGDRLKISQVFINLVSNAIKFTSNGNIWIKASLVSETEKKVKYKFEVKDSGIGIKKELQSHVFDGFKGVEHINQYRGGSGLGLFIVKKIIEDLYGSRIFLKSEVNKGTSFTFELELERMQEDLVDPKLKSLKLESVLEEYTLLVVDDNKVNLMITKKIVETAGATCYVTDNGPEAVKMIRKDHFDIVLMDVHMPGQDGLETTRQIREFNKDVIIIALTAVDLEKMVTRIYRSGMNSIVTKPYKRKDLFLKIQSLVIKKQRKTI